MTPSALAMHRTIALIEAGRAAEARMLAALEAQLALEGETIAAQLAALSALRTPSQETRP
jgi:outer membrane lipopolysaccharide assembly protein LptE/RlpB